MTQREFFEAIIKAEFASDKIIDTEAKTLVTVEDVKAFAKERIAHLDTVNSNRKAKGTVTQRENEGIKANILAGVKPNVTYTANEIGVMVGISTAKASALCRQFVQAKTFTESEVKIKGKGKVKGYTFTVEDNPTVEVDPIDKVYTLPAEPTVED